MKKRKSQHATDLSREATLVKRKHARLERKVLAKETAALADTLDSLVHVSGGAAKLTARGRVRDADDDDADMCERSEGRRSVTGGRVRKRNDARKKAAERRAKIRTRMEARMSRDVAMGETDFLEEKEEVAPFRFVKPLDQTGNAAGSNGETVSVVGRSHVADSDSQGIERKAGRVVKVRKKSAAKIRREERKARSRKVMQLHTLASIEAGGN